MPAGRSAEFKQGQSIPDVFSWIRVRATCSCSCGF